MRNTCGRKGSRISQAFGRHGVLGLNPAEYNPNKTGVSQGTLRDGRVNLCHSVRNKYIQWELYVINTNNVFKISDKPVLQLHHKKFGKYQCQNKTVLLLLFYTHNTILPHYFFKSFHQYKYSSERYRKWRHLLKYSIYKHGELNWTGKWKLKSSTIEMVGICPIYFLWHKYSKC